MTRVILGATGSVGPAGPAGPAGPPGSAAGVIVPLGNVSGVVTCDLSQGTVFTGTQTGDVTAMFTNCPVGLVQPLLLMKQDATGGHKLTVPAAWLPSGPPLTNTNPGALNVISLFSADRGVHLYGDNGADAGMRWTAPMGVPAPDAPLSAGTWVVSGTPSLLTNTSAALADTIGWDFNLAAGSYSLDLLYSTGAAYGGLTALLDGVSIGTVSESGSSVSNLSTTLPFVVPASGLHRISFVPANGFPTTTLRDNFNRTENPLSFAAAWNSTGIYGASMPLKTDGTHALYAAGGYGGNAWNTTMALPFAIAVDLAGAPFDAQGLDLYWIDNATSATPNGYFGKVNSASWTIAKATAGVTGVLAQQIGGLTVGATDSIGMTISTGGTIGLWQKASGGLWVLLGSATDTTFNSGSKYPAIDTASSGVLFDNFYAATVAAVAQLNIQALGFRRLA